MLPKMQSLRLGPPAYCPSTSLETRKCRAHVYNVLLLHPSFKHFCNSCGVVTQRSARPSPIACHVSSIQSLVPESLSEQRHVGSEHLRHLRESTGWKQAADVVCDHLQTTSDRATEAQCGALNSQKRGDTNSMADWDEAMIPGLREGLAVAACNVTSTTVKNCDRQNSRRSIHKTDRHQHYISHQQIEQAAWFRTGGLVL